MNQNANSKLATLSFCNFVVGTGAFIMSGILPMVASGLNRSVFEIGQTAGIFSLAFAIGAPLLAGPTSRINRRTLLEIGLGLFVLASIMGALAPNYLVLMISRVLAGLGGALITPHAATAAAMVVPNERKGQAIALVLLGYAASTVVGVPLGTIVGDMLGWRWALGVLGILGAIAFVCLRFTLPASLDAPPIAKREWSSVFTNRPILIVLCVTLFQVLGQATVLTYFAVLLKSTLQADATLISTMLMVYGIGGVCGTYFSSRLVDKLGAHFMVNLSVILMTIAMAAWSFGSTNVILTGALILLWGLGSFAVNGAQQFRLIAAAPALATASLPLNSSASFAGQAVAALIGGAIVSGMSPSILPIAGGIFLGMALIVSSVLVLQRPLVQPFEVAGSQTKAGK